jgi:hypothetical protein
MKFIIETTRNYKMEYVHRVGEFRPAGRGVVNKSDLMLYLRKQPDLQERVTQE